MRLLTAFFDMRFTALIFLGMLIAFSGCQRTSSTEIQFRSCLADEATMGSFLFASLESAETALIRHALRDSSREAYIGLAEMLRDDELHLSESELAPDITDFWELRSAATVGAFERCAALVSDASDTLTEEHPVYQLNVFYQGRSGNITPETLLEMIGTFSDDVFENLIYRGAVISAVIQLAE